MNEIRIRGLKLECHIGVPDEERATAQTLLVDLTIVPLTAFDELNDDIARTVDYDAVCQRLAAIAGDHPRQLIETLAVDLAWTVVKEFPAAEALVEIRKFILPQTDHVGVAYRARRQK